MFNRDTLKQAQKFQSSENFKFQVPETSSSEIPK